MTSPFLRCPGCGGTVPCQQHPETTDASKPHRACRLVLDLEADDRKALADSLYNMADRIERGEMTKGVSGGYSSGYIYELTESDRPTHAEYMRELNAYLDAAAAIRATTPPGEAR